MNQSTWIGLKTGYRALGNNDGHLSIIQVNTNKLNNGKSIIKRCNDTDGINLRNINKFMSWGLVGVSSPIQLS